MTDLATNAAIERPVLGHENGGRVRGIWYHRQGKEDMEGTRSSRRPSRAGK